MTSYKAGSVGTNYPPELTCPGVYSITNTVTGRVYIGRTTTWFCKRWQEHRNRLRAKDHSNKQLQADWLIYGEATFEFRVIEQLSEISSRALFDKREQHYIYAMDMPYNLRLMTRFRVKELAQEQGMNISDLHRRASLMSPDARIGRTTILRLWHNRNANPRMDSLIAVARALGVTPADLMTEDEPTTTP